MNKGMTFRTEVLTPDEITDIIDCIENPLGNRVNEELVARNLAMFMLMYRAGLRRKEVCQLDLKDIDLDRGIVHVRHGKGNKERRAGIDAKGVEYIRDYIKIRRTWPGPLFVTSSGNRLRHWPIFPRR